MARPEKVSVPSGSRFRVLDLTRDPKEPTRRTRDGSVTARIGFSVDSDLHEKSLRRIGSRWCKNHVESDLDVFVSVHFFVSVQNEFVVRSKTLSPILNGETVI